MPVRFAYVRDGVCDLRTSRGMGAGTENTAETATNRKQYTTMVRIMMIASPVTLVLIL